MHFPYQAGGIKYLLILNLFLSICNKICSESSGWQPANSEQILLHMVKYRFKISKSFIPPAWYGRCIKRFNRFDSRLGKIFVIQLGHAGFVILALGWLPAASQQNKNMKKKLARLKKCFRIVLGIHKHYQGWKKVHILRRWYHDGHIFHTKGSRAHKGTVPFRWLAW